MFCGASYSKKIKCFLWRREKIVPFNWVNENEWLVFDFCLSLPSSFLCPCDCTSPLAVFCGDYFLVWMSRCGHKTGPLLVLCRMTACAELYILLWVWVALTWIQGHSGVRKFGCVLGLCNTYYLCPHFDQNIKQDLPGRWCFTGIVQSVVMGRGCHLLGWVGK